MHTFAPPWQQPREVLYGGENKDDNWGQGDKDWDGGGEDFAKESKICI